MANSVAHILSLRFRALKLNLTIGCDFACGWAASGDTLSRMQMLQDSRIYVAGHRGLAGSAIWRELRRQGFCGLLGRTHAELDLLDGAAVGGFYAREKPEFVFIAAARVGGIMANDSLPAQFLFENLQIQNNLIHGAYLNGVKKLLFLGSSCIYPRLAPQPLKEEYLLSGPLEPPTNGMPSPKSPASNCARPAGANTGAISSAPCRPTSTG